jgi:uncharacterized protein (TIGR03083 family)
MTGGAIEALRADREALVRICNGLGDLDFEAESGCARWSVKDVVAHMGALFWMVVDPSVLPDTTGLPTERAQDVCVESRRSWSAAQVVADYESVSDEALGRLAGLDDLDFELALGDLGTYPARVLPSAYSFDHYTHIRADLFAPRGPLKGTPPPSDELRLAPALDWVEAALAQQNPAAVDALNGAIEMVLSGPGARTIRVGPGEVTARVTSDTRAFVLWVTARADWGEVGAHWEGDEEQLAVARSLHVF